MRKSKKMLSRVLLGAFAAMTVTAMACNKKSAEENPSESAAPVEVVEVPELEGYTLLWHDEFSGAAMDESIWSYDPHEPGWTNEELQEYTTSTENVFTRDGKMVLKAIKTTDENGNDYYTSGKIKSQNKEDFMYGKIVVSAKVPEGQGLWPAIWMMPTDESYYGQWPKCGEIDIMEVLGSDVTTAYGTVHYGEPHAEQQGIVTLDSGSFAEDFHEYSVEWEPGEMRWYIDGNLYLTVNDWFTAVAGEDEKEYPAPFNQTFFVQLNLAVGGTWPGNPDETTDFDNAEFLIDYVRVYQKPEYDTNVQKPAKVFKEADATGNFITNGDFSDPSQLGTDLAEGKDWTFLLFEGGAGSAIIEDNTMIIKTDAEGTVDYSVQLVQPDIPMLKGHNYRLTFDCWADEERELITCVSAPNAGWIRYLEDTTFKATTKPQTFTFDFTMTEKDDNKGRLEFNMGNKGSKATIYIQNVRLEEVE
ncbi:MAG: family 16 glycosylhydrolase [Lachnospiraceae bacterium]|nr:family 16 glycosylhydrolase [Lachnospiraceae bacterium]